MYRHYWLQPHIQKLLGPVTIPCCEERHTGAPLGIRPWAIKIARIIPWNKVNDMRLNYMVDHQEVTWVSAKPYWLLARSNTEKLCWQCDICAASHGPWTSNQGQMHQYNVRTPFKRIAINVAGPFLWTKETSISWSLWTILWRVWEPTEFPIKRLWQWRNCWLPASASSEYGGSYIMTRAVTSSLVRCLGVSKMQTTPLHPQSDGMVERYIKTAEEHLWMVVTLHQRDWDTRWPFSLLVYWAFIHDTMGLTPASLMFETELHLSCDLLFVAPPNREWPTIDHAAHLLDHPHNMHSYSHPHLKLANDQMKTHYDRLANCTGYHKGDKTWPYHPTQMKGK
jgi:hypothetical protein